MAESSTAAAETAALHPSDMEGMEAELLSAQVDELNFKADELEKKVLEVVNFHDKKQQCGSVTKGAAAAAATPTKEKGSNSANGGNNSASTSNSKQPAELSKDAACSKRMQDLIRQFGTILRQVTYNGKRFLSNLSLL